MGHNFLSETADFYTYSEFTRQGQVLLLSLTYRINNYKDKRNKDRGSDDFGGDMEME